MPIAVFAYNFNGTGQWGEKIGIVVGLYPLQHHAEAFKAHPGVHVALGQWFERASGLAVELNKDQVPDLHHLGVVFIYQSRP